MRITELNKFNNDWYNPGPKLKRAFWFICNALFLQNKYNPSSGVKVAILKLFGANIGKGVVIKPNVSVKYPWKLEIGDYVWIGENVWIDNLAFVRIGNNVCVSQGAMLLCGNHNYKKSTFDLMIGEIKLEDGSWVGAQSVVCPGITMKSHSILSVGSVATKDLEAYTIYQGNPAEEVRKREIIE